jgi:hypothetical protein
MPRQSVDPPAFGFTQRDNARAKPVYCPASLNGFEGAERIGIQFKK